MPPEIKFCGMTRGRDVAEAAALGARYVGAIFAGGPRHQSLTAARRMLRGTNRPPRRVAVVGDQPISEIVRLVDALTIDVIQLHADPDMERVGALKDATGVEVWAVVRVAGSTLPPLFDDLIPVADAVVLDARVAGGLGGSGVTLPWADLARSLATRRGNGRVVLAGGLQAENVTEAIATLAPDIVDVSSGVESAPGIKDSDRMRAFRDAVHRAG